MAELGFLERGEPLVSNRRNSLSHVEASEHPARRCNDVMWLIVFIYWVIMLPSHGLSPKLLNDSSQGSTTTTSSAVSPVQSSSRAISTLHASSMAQPSTVCVSRCPRLWALHVDIQWPRQYITTRMVAYPCDDIPDHASAVCVCSLRRVALRARLIHHR